MNKKLCAPIITLGLMLCTAPAVRRTVLVPPADAARAIVTTATDTILYTVELSSKKERRNFTQKLEEFFIQFPYEKMPAESATHEVRIRVLPPAEEKQREEAIPQPAGPAAIAEAGAEQPPLEIPVPGMDTGQFTTGGTLAIYSYRGFLDPALSRLVRPAFSAQTADSNGIIRFTLPGFRIENSTPRRIIISLTSDMYDCAGRVLTAFDLVSRWTTYAREHPAEGRALFRYVKGFDGFIRGREATVQGISAVDGRTVALTLDTPDPLGGVRLASPRLHIASLGMGNYCIKQAMSDMVTLTPHPGPLGQSALLNSCTIRLGGEANPLVGFSLAKYGAMTLTSRQDAEYIRTKMTLQAALAPFAEDHYFLAFCAAPPGTAAFVRAIVQCRDLLAQTVKADGFPLAGIESADTAPAIAAPALPQAPALTRPLSVIYRKDDPASAAIAEKLLAVLTQATVQAALQPLDEMGYEQALVRRDWALAVGFAPSAVVHDKSEKLRLATLWFSDEADESRRIASGMELPLFSVTTYIAIHRNTGFRGGRFAGVHVRQP
jgi:hypothetical protein